MKRGTVDFPCSQLTRQLQKIDCIGGVDYSRGVDRSRGVDDSRGPETRTAFLRQLLFSWLPAQSIHTQTLFFFKFKQNNQLLWFGFEFLLQ